ncbi:DUF1127 domain-containing protein [Acuticoccus kalidii]|uniref:DUF1127 domain-containing protein n=1 Tax=Acuticoccus kalidii TaxID=2910977 RepID=UPI0034E283CC
MSLVNSQDRGWAFATAERVTDGFSRMKQAVVAAEGRRRAINRTYRELNELSDRHLADLGFARCDLRKVARQSVEQG